MYVCSTHNFRVIAVAKPILAPQTLTSFIGCPCECAGLSKKVIRLNCRVSWVRIPPRAALLLLSCPGCSWLVCLALPFYLVTKAFSHVAERRSSLGKEWHPTCLRCGSCDRLLSPGGHCEVHPLISLISQLHYIAHFMGTHLLLIHNYVYLRSIEQWSYAQFLLKHAHRFRKKHFQVCNTKTITALLWSSVHNPGKSTCRGRVASKWEMLHYAL